MAVGVERGDRESQRGGLAPRQAPHRDLRPARSPRPRTACRHIEHEPHTGLCPQQELFGSGNQSGVTVAVDGEQQSGQFIGVAATPGLDDGCGVAELLCGRPNGEAVVVRVRRDAGSVAPATESRQ
jgi:hypothetical protein